MIKTYHKLVRDKIPQIIRQGGNSCTTCVLDTEEYLQMLDQKLQEELKAFLGESVPVLPGRELTLYDTAVVSRAWEQKRLRPGNR